MSEFPRTEIEGVSVPRLMPGTNWFYGGSHTSRAKDKGIREVMSRRRVAEIMGVFLDVGIDAIYGLVPDSFVADGVKDAEDRAGRKITRISIPTLNIADGPEALDETAKTLDAYAALGVDVCMPHQCTTDALADRHGRRIVHMDRYVAMIRERGMIPGLSTHMPEVPIYADETGLDIATYIQIYNAAGFLMQIEVDWVHRMIWKAAKPVIVIKPLAAGRLHPLVGLAFVWATLRPRDMVCIGTLSAEEAREVIDLSFSLLDGRGGALEQLQRTRSKASIDGE